LRSPLWEEPSHGAPGSSFVRRTLLKVNGAKLQKTHQASQEVAPMKELYSEIEIDASAERVWGILTDFASYPKWNPYIRRISGEPKVGERLEVRFEPPGSRGITLKPKVLKAEPERELRWLGHLLVAGLFDGEHTLAIQPLALEENRVRFSQGETFGGLLVPLFARSLDKSTQRGFEEMNRALKERAEVAPTDTNLHTSEKLHG
jgi:hypothetical protein